MKNVNTNMNKYEKKIITVPNIISFIRLILIIIAANLLIKEDFINSFILYLIAVITDFLDGFLARGLKQISNLGKILDPLVDKLMIGSAIIILLYKSLMPAWYVIVVLGCSLINIIGGLIVIKKYNYVPSAILMGKIAAVSVMLTFLFNIAYSHTDLLIYVYTLSSFLLIISVCVYAYKIRNYILNNI